MDPRERADAALARARARGAFVVTPESAISPMDAASTLQLPRIVVSENDEHRDPNATVIVPRPDPHGARTEDNIPAIAQESFTDVVGSPPGIRSRQRRIEDARARALAARIQTQVTEPEQPVPIIDQPDDSLPPTPPQGMRAQPHEGMPQPNQPPPGTGSLSQRLDG